LWGYLATISSVRASILTAAALGPLVFVLTKRYSLGVHRDRDVTPAASE
jgi:hypothetical protein